MSSLKGNLFFEILYSFNAYISQQKVPTKLYGIVESRDQFRNAVVNMAPVK